MKPVDYPFTIRHLTKEEGGGFLIEFMDLPGCMSDGEDAVNCWLAAAKASHRTIPKPSDGKQQSGKWVQRVPKSLHSRLTQCAKQEGVSLNTFVVTILAEALGTPAAHKIGQRKGLRQAQPPV